MATILVTGAGAGLGAAIFDALMSEGHLVFGFDRKAGDDVRCPERSLFHAPPDGLEVLINCAGVNRTNWLEDVADDDWDEVIDVNAKGIFKMTQWCLPELKKTRGTVVNIVSNAAHVPMTCSLAYNASKGAAHIMTLQLARELTKKWGITVFGIAPNKLAGTEMSADIERQVVEQRGWTREQAAQDQLAALLSGEETPPARVADFLAFLLSDKERHRFLSGCVLPYGA